jgi:hypothetical protein
MKKKYDNNNIIIASRAYFLQVDPTSNAAMPTGAHFSTPFPPFSI